MPVSTLRGATLLELLLAVVILAGLVLASAPIAVRTADLSARGRALADGATLAASRRTLSAALPCIPASGRDTTPRATLDWRLDPSDSTLTLTAVLRDAGGRWPSETLSTILPCQP
jgi:type II secretory pathway pseudopilin PulG